MNKQDIGKYVAILGVVFLLALPWGIANTFYAIYNLFQEITVAGTGDPKLMAAGLSSALVTTVLGLVMCFPGLVLLLIAITVCRYRPYWLFWITLTSSTLLVFMIPIGSILGLIGLIIIVLKRKHFYPKNKFA
ncbi:MotA/TolQ/ExbB proton channel family protein [Glaciecola sp. 1036]|uniref:MotA/TolQ/ExbB proton channel family protein n=1 Tax=Alteromonadaceae TaxID=72275 RepID=UPI003D0215F3